ncbi:unnamed protein product [Brachionus calyciflorus]|uniref:Uncharacterized protein n=1 Tax=Brachionus calyciflorus TaxID=104777 RepID=A0A814B1R9_9BILA|nr:unnamed protein product [Brachionus calyciflorus]
MPTSNGQDRSNYTTTINFSKTAKRRSKSDFKQQESKINNMAQTDSFRKQVNRVLASQEAIRAPLDPAYVYIPDQRLREIVQKLVNSEQDRLTNNVDPNLITQINHRGCSLFFSRIGSNPFEVNQNVSQGQVEQQQQQQIQQQPQNIPKVAFEENFVNKSNEPIPPQTYVNNNNMISSSTQKIEPSNLIYTERAPNIIVSPQPVINNEIPPEANRIIQQDLAQNPLVSGERTYRIVLNKTNSAAGEEPKILKVVVRSQSVPKLPQIQPKYVIQQPKPQIIQYQMQPNINTQNSYYEGEPQNNNNNNNNN